MVKAETEQLINRYTKVARIPGFRKGKVPAGIIRQRFAEDIKGEIVEQLGAALLPRRSAETRTVPGVAAAGYRSCIFTKASR